MSIKHHNNQCLLLARSGPSTQEACPLSAKSGSCMHHGMLVYGSRLALKARIILIPLYGFMASFHVITTVEEYACQIVH